MVLVYKFGGASVKNAEGFRRVFGIIGKCIQEQKPEKLLVVVSAINKTTNLLEKCVRLSYGGENYDDPFESFRQEHKELVGQLINDPNFFSIEIDQLILEVKDKLGKKTNPTFDAFYDDIVSYGEIIASTILVKGLREFGLDPAWLDAKEIIITDSTFRAAKVNLDAVVTCLNQKINSSTSQLFVTQGFIGKDQLGNTTTLGREGSDYTASLLAFAIGAKSVTIWKDVPGVLNADPKLWPEAELMRTISYQLAAEMTYYGASVIHPKTIEPLIPNKIPLVVRSFLNQQEQGTTISSEATTVWRAPIIMLMKDVVLITCKPYSFAYVNEKQVTSIFHYCAELECRSLLVQHSAMSISIVVHNDINRANSLRLRLEKEFDVLFNAGLDLLTIKNTNTEIENRFIGNNSIILKQVTRHTSHFLLQPA